MLGTGGLSLSLRELDEQEAIQLVINLLKEAGSPLTTREIEEKTRKHRVSCPDSTPMFLNKLRLKGILGGELSREKRGWVWWIKTEG